MPDPSQTQDTLSSEDLAALFHAQQQLAAAGDPRSEKLRQYLVAAGHASLDAQKNIQPKQDLSAFGFTPGNVLKNVGQGLAELGKGGVQMLSDVGGAILPQKLGGDPITDLQLVHHIVDPMQAEAAKSRQGGPGSVGHAIASGIPVIGPYAANLGEQAASGDVGGALARGVTQYAAPKAIAPVATAITRGAGRAALLGKTPEGAYESAMKPSTTIPEAQRAAFVKTGLDNEIPVSKAGLEKIGTLIDDLNQKVKDTIAADPNREISPVPALRNLQSVRSKFATQVNPTADVQAVDAAGQEFADQLNTGGIGPNPQRNLTAAEAQAMKQGTYRALGSKAYGGLKGASVEAQKALARGLKDEIATQFPELKNLNATEGKLLDLEPVLERAVNRIGNHQIIGIGSPVTGAAAKAVTGSTGAGAVAFALKGVLDNPMVKSRLAIAVSKAGKIPFAQAAARVQAYSTSIGQYAAAQGAVSSDEAPANQTTQ